MMPRARPVERHDDAIVFIEPYTPDELRFAYCYRVYIRWRTYRGKSLPQLAKLDHATLSALSSDHQIRVLGCATDETDLLAEVNLNPTETISGCASKLKGRVSKWLRGELKLDEPTDLLSKGYFAATVGKSTREQVEQYLSSQGEHHGYGKRVLPPSMWKDMISTAQMRLGSAQVMPL
jgi:REP element-mobilizing transposase RayT